MKRRTETLRSPNEMRADDRRTYQYTEKAYKPKSAVEAFRREPYQVRSDCL
jgi:hypothetical protein